MGVWRKIKNKLVRSIGYDGAGHDRGSWTPVDGDAEAINGMSRDILRSRARDLERNADYVEAAILAMERNVVGSGMTLDCGVEDSKLEEAIEQSWKEWCHAENCDVSGRFCFSEMLKLAVRRMMVDGGVLIVAAYSGTEKYPLQLQIKEVDELDGSVQFCGGNKVIGGVEINEYNRAVAYHFTTYGLYGATGQSVRIPADRVIFLKHLKRPSQVREISGFANILSRLRDLNQFITAVSIKERILACYAVFIKKVQSVLPGRNKNNVDPKTNAQKRTLAPGMIMELDPGDEIQVANPSGQASNAKDMITTLLRAVSSALGLSYEAVSRDMSQSTYSSARQNLIEDRETYREWQHYLAEHFCRKVYAWWLESCVLAKTVLIPDFFTNREKYVNCSWVAKGTSWIDPLKEVSANSKAMESYQTTLQEVAAERGQDWKQILQQRAKEQNKMRELGLEGDNDGTVKSKPEKSE